MFAKAGCTYSPNVAISRVGPATTKVLAIHNERKPQYTSAPRLVVNTLFFSIFSLKRVVHGCVSLSRSTFSAILVKLEAPARTIALLGIAGSAIDG
jgi:hypothetical protein